VFKKALLIVMIIALPMVALATTDDGKPVKVITDGDIGALNYWYSDTVYNLSGFVYVEDGEVLIIEPGTVIKGNPGQAEFATALVVARGGRIYAEGTECNPIIFTSIADDVDIYDDIDLSDPTSAKGLWGGLIILGKAQLPGTDTTGGTVVEGQIEGIPETEVRGAYGGIDDEDNSGVLKYVSVRHGGSEIGEANEINGVTMGAVGDGTILEYVEVFYNLDDGFEWFGGTVSAKHLLTGFCGDDGFDVDEGYRGSLQFIFNIHEADPTNNPPDDPGEGDRAAEHDGTFGSALGTCPRASVLVSNATYIGRGSSIPVQRCFELRDNMSGAYYNSIFTGHGTYGLQVEDDPAGSTLDRLKEGNLKFHNNVWYDFGGGNTSFDITNSKPTVDTILFYAHDWSNYNGALPSQTIDNKNYLSTTNVIAAEGTHLPDGSLDPRQANTSSWFLNAGASTWAWVDPTDATDYIGYHPSLTDPLACIDSAHYAPFETVDYAGAFDPSRGTTWAHNWSALDSYGYLFAGDPLADCDCITDDNKDVVVITDADINGFTVFDRDNVYNLSGFVFVEDGDTLLIEPGTVLKSNPGQAEFATALVVARGGLIYAVGDECCPVIFTSINDDVDLTGDIDLTTPATDAKGLWGGVIILGNAVICDTLEGQIEGIPETEPRGAYGGSDDEDNSGVLRYVSIRHGGSEIGEANEINGLTMGGVGCGTRISHIEVFMNLDDGYEWFGGSVNADHLVAAFVGDDQFDYDECWRGGGQFWFGIHEADPTNNPPDDPGEGDRSGEHDGGYGSDVAACPVTTPLFSNVTYVGRGTDIPVQRCLEIRDAAAAGYWNSIFTDHGTYGANFEEKPAEDIDSWTRLQLAQLRFYNNIWYGFGGGNTSLDIMNGKNTADTILFYTYDQSSYNPALPSMMVNNQNYLSCNQVVRNIDRGQNMLLDPRYDCGTNTFTNESATPWTAWANPLDADPITGYHPEIIADPFCGYDNPCWYDMEVVDFPGAFDPAKSMDDSWIAGWSFLYCGGYIGDAPDPDCDCNGGCCEIVGDINGDGASIPDIADLVYLVAFMFQGGPAPDCMEEADINGDQGSVPDIADLVYLVAYMFSGGPAPVPCQ